MYSNMSLYKLRQLLQMSDIFWSKLFVSNARAIPNAKETMGGALMQPICAAGFGKLMSDYYF